MTFKPVSKLSERETTILQIAREIGYDHMASMWNTVDKRLEAELDGYTVSEAITTQLNTALRGAMFTILHLLEVVGNIGIKGETPDELAIEFSKNLRKLLARELKARKEGMN
jgi:phage gp45-like